jgi:acyl-CoA thioesterase-2
MEEDDALELDPVARFLALLTLQPDGEDRFLASTPAEGPPRLFGGQVAAQSLRAATMTVPADRLPHSLHAYFIRPGRPGVPLELSVERARDGRSFTTRRVSAAQEGEPIFVLDASFQIEEDGEDWQPDFRFDGPSPDEIPPVDSPMGRFSSMSPFDMRPAVGRSPMGFPVHPFWVRLNGRLPDDPLLHACAITFISDMGVVGAAPRPGTDRTRGFMGASLDHAVWLHVPARADEWLLFDVQPLRNAGARGLAHGTMHDQRGVLVASIAQEALLRPTMTMPPEMLEAMRRLSESANEPGA